MIGHVTPLNAPVCGMSDNGITALLLATSGAVIIRRDPPNEVKSGKKLLDAVAEALDAEACSVVMLQADKDNTGVVYIGDDTSQELQIQAGDSVVIEIDRLDRIYARGEGQTIRWLLVRYAS